MTAHSTFRIFLAGVGFIVFPAPAQEPPEKKSDTINATNVSRVFPDPSARRSVGVTLESPLQPPPALPRSSVAADLTKALDDVFSQARGAVVRVVGGDRHGRLNGTGFFVDAVGTVLTTRAVVGDAEEVRVMMPSSNRGLPARVLASDPRSGIAIVRVETSASSTPFLLAGKSIELAVGSPVISLSYPSRREPTRSLGLVETFERESNGIYLNTTHIRVVMPVQRGSSGAPLLNFDGEVVGVIVSGMDGICYALPIEAANKILAEVTRYGTTKPAWMGVTAEISHDGAVVVASTDEGSPARKAVILVGDTLVAIGDRKIEKVDDVIDVSFFLSEGDRVIVSILRGDEEKEIPVTVGKRPSSAPKAADPSEFNLLGK